MGRQVVGVRFGRGEERDGPGSDAVAGMGDILHQRGQVDRREASCRRQLAREGSLLQVWYERFS